MNVLWSSAKEYLVIFKIQNSKMAPPDATRLAPRPLTAQRSRSYQLIDLLTGVRSTVIDQSTMFLNLKMTLYGDLVSLMILPRCQ